MTRPLAIVALIFAACSTASARGNDGLTYTVCQSGCDFTSIQDAIDHSIAPATIQVQAGTYNENGINTHGQPFTIVGEVGPDGTLQTVITGAGLAVNGDSSIFIFKSGETADTVLQDLHIKDGTCEVQSGGVYIKGCSPTLRNCTISQNTSVIGGGTSPGTFGGGLSLMNSDSLITNCRIIENSAEWHGSSDASGGGVYIDGGSPTFSDCVIANNSIYQSGPEPCPDCNVYDPCGAAQGMGFYIGSGTGNGAVIERCLIIGNTVKDRYTLDCTEASFPPLSTGGGIYQTGNGFLSITDTVIEGNWAASVGGVYAFNSVLDMTRCLVADNPGGVLVDSGPAEIVTAGCTVEECIFADNQGVALFPGTTYNGNTVPAVIRSCIFYGNEVGVAGYNAELTITDCRIAGNDLGAEFKRSTVTLDRCVVTDNHATSSESASKTGGILIDEVNGSVTVDLQRTLVCGNSINGITTDANQFAPSYPNSNITLDSESTVSSGCQTTLTVNPDGTADYTDIQDAIDASFWGGTVSIAAGSYPGGIEINDRRVTLAGAIGPDKLPATIIDGGGSQQALAIRGRYADATIIRNLEIRNGYTKGGAAGLSVTDASPTIVNCVFRQNQTGSFGGGIAFMNSDSTLQRCLFMENTASPGGGVYIDGESSVTTSDCEFIENSGGSGGGAIFVAQDGELTCKDSAFEINTVLPQFQGGAIKIESGATAEVTGSILCGNSPDQIAGAYTDGGGNSLEEACLRNVTVTVAGDGDADFETITAAIGAVGAGSTIQIAAGDYAEELNTQGKAVRLVGAVDSNGEPTTTISPPRIKQSTLLTCDQGEGRSTVFENLRFTNGYNPREGAGGINCDGASPTFVNCRIYDNFGYAAGGMYCENGSQPLLLECVFRRNTGGFLDSGTGGIASASGSSPALEGCVLCDNEPGNEEAPANIGGNWTDLGRNIIESGACPQVVFVGPESSGSTPIQTAIDDASDGAVIIIAAGLYRENLNTGGKALTLRGRVAQDGSLLTTIDGGGLGAVITCSEGESSSTTIENLIIRDGSEGGIRIANASPTISGCRIILNTGPAGGGINATSSTAVITDCLIAFNEADLGGGIATSNASLLVKQCRLSNNTAISGPGIATAGANLPGFQNTSLCGNLASDGGRIPQIDGNYVDLDGNTISTACDIFVAQDGNGDYTTIQAAIDAADPPAVIVVAPGTYFENLNTQGKAVIIEGTLDDLGQRMTVVNGGQIDSVVSCVSGETPETVLRNLVLTNGTSTDGSGGIYIWQASPTVENCAIVDNHSYLGGGMSINTSTTTITGCLIAGNQATNSGGALWITNSAFSDAGIRILDSIITENSCDEDPGIAVTWDSSASIGGSAICGNTSGASSAMPQIGGAYADLGGNVIATECPTPACLADINRDGIVDGADFAYILERWGSDDPLADLNGDGQVDSADLGLAIADWGDCT